MKNKLLAAALLLLSVALSAQTQSINQDLQVRKLTDNIYLYTAWAEIGQWGRVGSNGLIVQDGKRAFLLDTPMHEQQTKELNHWIRTSLKASLTGFIPGHWHDDCVGGLAYLNGQGVKTYANRRTNEILKTKQQPTAQQSIPDTFRIDFGQTEIVCIYLGGGHATDNVVTWLPRQKILFGGCLIKDTSSTGLGNTSDAAHLNEWLATIEKAQKQFADAQTIVPGHGNTGGTELLDHTQKLLKQNIRTINKKP